MNRKDFTNMPVNRIAAWSVGGSLVLAVGGCAVGPNYAPPSVETPLAYGESAASTQPATQPSTLGSWWEVFDDPQLTALIDRAVAGNNDLKIAAARVQEGRALYIGSKSGLFPALDGKAGYRHDRRGSNEDGLGSGASGFASDPDRHNWSAGFDASWEIDIFGGVRRSIEASDADFGAIIEDQRDVLITLVSDVARNYIILRGAQRQLIIVEKNLQTQDQTLDLTRSRFRAGLTSDLDVARAEAQALTTRSQIPPLQDQVRQAIRRISVLCGSNPETLKDELSD
ncbi:MAG TPA: TolC family protein, partial [Tepidisphaeraceae bacterium]|nr:TolC family protein [Tepidisphaeraceae bacterium]